MGYRGPQRASSEPQGITAAEPYKEPPPRLPTRYPVHKPWRQRNVVGSWSRGPVLQWQPAE